LKVHDEWTDVPCVSRFHGIAILMYRNEGIHPGRPHFHARYAGVTASYDIRTSERIAGRLPPRVERLVRRWASRHQDELSENWVRCQAHLPPRTIDPLT
jgi:hypothetical protein